MAKLKGERHEKMHTKTTETKKRKGGSTKKHSMSNEIGGMISERKKKTVKKYAVKPMFKGGGKGGYSYHDDMISNDGVSGRGMAYKMKGKA